MVPRNSVIENRYAIVVFMREFLAVCGKIGKISGGIGLILIEGGKKYK
jgi:hypothetical protein